MRFWIYSLSLVSLLQAQGLDENILSKTKAQELYYSKEKVDAESSKLRDSWLNPIMMSYSGSFKDQFGFSQESYGASVSIDQPIFKSGGIYFAIKYANATAHFNSLGIAIEKNAIISQTFSLIMQLKKLDLSLKQAQLLEADAQDELAYNIEQLSVGEIDTAQLSSSEIALNESTMRRIDLENQRRDLNYQLQIFSEVDYKTVALPRLKLVEKEDFFKHHMELKQLGAKQTRDRYFKNITISKYLPSVSATASYNYSRSVDQAFSENFAIGDVESSYSSYGFRVSMPLFDVNTFRDIQSAKVDYLKSNVQFDAKKIELSRFYVNQIAKVKGIDTKITLSQKNEKLYTKVLTLIKDGYAVGDQSKLILDKTQHMLSIKHMDVEMIRLDKQIELLKLYEKLHDL